MKILEVCLVFALSVAFMYGVVSLSVWAVEKESKFYESRLDQHFEILNR